MPEIKTKGFVDAREVFEGVTDLGDRMRRGLGHGGDYARNLADDGQVSSNEYASDLFQNTAEELSFEAGHIAIGTTKEMLHHTHRTYINQLEHRKSNATNAPPRTESIHLHKSNGQPITQPDAATRSAQLANKSTFKTMAKSVKDSQHTVKAPQQMTRISTKVSRDVAEAEKSATHITATTVCKSAELLPKLARSTDKAARVTAKAAAELAKSVTAAVEEFAGIIASGGWGTLVVIAAIFIILIIVIAVMTHLGSTIALHG